MPEIYHKDIKNIKKKPGIHVLIFIIPYMAKSVNFVNYILEVASSKNVECLICNWMQSAFINPNKKFDKIFSIILLQSRKPLHIINNPDHETVLNLFTYIGDQTTNQIRLERNYNSFHKNLSYGYNKVFNIYNVGAKEGFDINWTVNKIKPILLEENPKYRIKYEQKSQFKPASINIEEINLQISNKMRKKSYENKKNARNNLYNRKERDLKLKSTFNFKDVKLKSSKLEEFIVKRQGSSEKKQ